ncbi:MAG: CPBP family intramembrane metalloprotease [Lachnospiraceae bacterium]|nr:CPBP family intramembrane metalloprotease [Lachnospiraceae bacterium]
MENNNHISEQLTQKNNTEQSFSQQRSAFKTGKTIPQIIFGSAIWTCILAYILILAGQILGELAVLASGALKSDLGTTAGLYFSFAGIWLVLFLNALIRKNRPLFKAYGTGCKGNNAVNLLIGLLIGIGMNGAAILMAWMHGDIRMYFDKFELVPFIILFIAVFVQSAAEEMICRGFIYQRVLRTYRGRFWLAVIINSVFFGMIHLGNNGISAMAVVDLVVTGLLFSAMVYYFDSLWMAMAAHAGWNFTQSILAGLPNSGNVVPYSIFKLDAAAARDSFFYNVAFGVEGTVPAITIQAVVLVALVAVGIKLGGKPTDIWAGEET